MAKAVNTWYKNPSLINVSEGLLHVACAKATTAFTSSVLRLCNIALVLELCLRAVFPLPPKYTAKHSNNGVNCGVAVF